MMVTLRFTGLWRHADFMKLWAGQTISEFGWVVRGDALPLVGVLTLSATPAQMGLLAALGSLPALLIGLPAGAWIDRTRRKPIMIAADLASAALLASIPVAYLVGALRIEQFYVVAALAGGLALLFDVAYTSYLPSLVEREHVVEGNSKLSASESVAEIGGSALAGALVQALSAPLAVAVDALSFLASAVSLALIRKPEPRPPPPPPPHPPPPPPRPPGAPDPATRDRRRAARAGDASDPARADRGRDHQCFFRQLLRRVVRAVRDSRAGHRPGGLGFADRERGDRIAPWRDARCAGRPALRRRETADRLGRVERRARPADSAGRVCGRGRRRLPVRRANRGRLGGHDLHDSRAEPAADRHAGWAAGPDERQRRVCAGQCGDDRRADGRPAGPGARCTSGRVGRSAGIHAAGRVADRFAGSHVARVNLHPGEFYPPAA